MDDLIVIILTLIIAGVGALRQLKKKKQAEPNMEPQEETDSFWDLLEDEPEPIEQTENLDHEVEKEMVRPEQVKITPRYQFKANNEEKSVTVEEAKMEVKKPKLKSKLNEEFSLRKAVIYSEILNRKYN